MKLTDLLALLDSKVSFNSRLSVGKEGLTTSSYKNTMDSSFYATISDVDFYSNGGQIGFAGDGATWQEALADLVNEINIKSSEGMAIGKTRESAITIPSPVEIDCALEL